MSSSPNILYPFQNETLHFLFFIQQALVCETLFLSLTNSNSVNPYNNPEVSPIITSFLQMKKLRQDKAKYLALLHTETDGAKILTTLPPMSRILTSTFRHWTTLVVDQILPIACYCTVLYIYIWWLKKINL